MALDYFHTQIKRETDECILWPYALTGVGYGYLKIGGEQLTVHVLACELTHGPKPTPQHEAAHAPIICHNRDCFNPRHVRWATRRENMADAVLDRTTNRGERCAATRLTDQQVEAIRLRYVEGELQDVIRADYGISGSQVSRIITGARRAHRTDGQPWATAPSTLRSRSAPTEGMP